ncbi:hypothetical protein GCM10010964_30900 [Caldovatus sediminis]|uniref:Inhibitor of vertebrate lysozyme (Ivy) n=2 Tax=Caldovatus sediminis TaxID=2041189 RepID=A0A8J2ZD30_9PROT|nr:hypothetical protein GCM10010964_30900 [Caldovatus sediminis]
MSRERASPARRMACRRPGAARLLRALICAALSLAAPLAPSAGPAAPQTADEPPGAVAASALIGRPVAALLGQPGVAMNLRMAGGGWQRALAQAVRLPGPPLRLADNGRHLYGWGCAPAGCSEAGVFLAWDPHGEQIFAVLMDDRRPVLFVPPRAGRSWPAALAAPLREFDAEAAGMIRFAAGALR